MHIPGENTIIMESALLKNIAQIDMSGEKNLIIDGANVQRKKLSEAIRGERHHYFGKKLSRGNINRNVRSQRKGIKTQCTARCFLMITDGNLSESKRGQKRSLDNTGKKMSESMTRIRCVANALRRMDVCSHSCNVFVYNADPHKKRDENGQLYLF